MFARQCPLIELADTAMESWGDLWVLFLGRKGRGSEDSTCFQQDASSYASVASDNGESCGLVFSQ